MLAARAAAREAAALAVPAVAGGLQLLGGGGGRGLAAAPGASSSGGGGATPSSRFVSTGQPGHVFDERDEIVGAQTPVTKALWQQRYRWTDERLAAATPRDRGADELAKPPLRTVISYPFSSSPVLREHYRNPWGAVRIGRVLEDLDSLAGLVAFDHCDDGDPSTRPPLLVTATVEAIELRTSHLTLDQDMQLSGRVVWTGTSSMDIRLELEQGGGQQLSALVTFVARDPVSGKPTTITSVRPEGVEDVALFEERGRINAARKAERKQQAAARHHVSAEVEQWAEELLTAARTKRDLPALADANHLLMEETSLDNTFTCQPQQRNMHGRVFGGFLMRRAFELAHSAAYLFAGSRPRTIEIDRITFRRPVNVGDLITFRSMVTRTWPSARVPGKGVAHVQVEASVTQPEKLYSHVTNSFAFLFDFDLRRDTTTGAAIPPKQVLPSTEQQALEVAQLFGPGGKKAAAPPAPARSRGSSSASSSSSGSDMDDVPDTRRYNLATNTPVSRRLWQERYPWTEERLLAVPPRDPSTQAPKPPRQLCVTYPFSTDDQLREHYRSPWGEARIGRILEDLDSLTALVVCEHCDVTDLRSRPPLLVTAGVEAIELHSSKLSLEQDMTMRGRVVWTGSSSIDVRMELEQAGGLQLTALFTFVARDMLSNRPHPVAPLVPKTRLDRDMFCERQRANDRRRAARAAAAASSGSTLHHVSPEGERWAAELLAAAKSQRDMPALADRSCLLMDETSLENTFTCQPQQRNIHGRIFGGFLMRRAFELAHSTAYLFAGSRPYAVEVEEVTFKHPVSIGDLLRMRTLVLHTWRCPDDPTQGRALVQVEASVTQPEQRSSRVTNTFSFVMGFELARCPDTGAPVPPMRVLPSTEKQALEVARAFGPGSGWEHLRAAHDPPYSRPAQPVARSAPRRPLAAAKKSASALSEERLQALVAAPRLKQHISAEHPDGGQAAAAAAAAGSSERPGPQKPPPPPPGQQPKLNLPRKQVAAFAAFKEAVTDANKSVIAARKANMPDASREPPSKAAAAAAAKGGRQ
ncbi:Acyl-coenzyme A thioesterase mitochondrial [Micractinium conductrix]|uniref:Acyl-coenzyme A thioesterase mitochondrial n=1 Tax=Micractinium conductrix TaxID=554055 RepID=A0A2P6V5Y1_9CHLO|nr:Acyl-coenzyme A thioesterase mitochondrial [Micractinium conductrix]|eukprot:PSC69493.1 Acyl-coenzyme A thioesterase mitochondrial [Micractinium conductrix]